MSSSGQHSGRALPPEFLNNDPHGFAWGVWHDRTPRMVAGVRDTNPYGPAQRRALDALLAEIASGVMRPLGPHAPDRADWATWGREHIGRPWQDAPFLWSESYFYRRLLDATGFFEPGPWRSLDPFEYLKSAELADPDLEPDLAALDDVEYLDVAGQERAKLLASLWGNRADLGFRMGASAGSLDLSASMVIADDSAALQAVLGPAASVVLVADNAGRELLADLVLVDHLLRHQRASSVSLHVKPWPYYVSDATTTDVAACLRRLAMTPGAAAAAVASRLRAAIAAGTVRLFTHDFYCSPWSYHRMPASLAAEFEQASLTLMKGDLNYRRLVGDRDWPAITPFPEVASYFPGPVSVLRTLKSDVITGLDPATVAGLNASGERWRTDGNHGLVQVLRRVDPAAQCTGAGRGPAA